MRRLRVIVATIVLLVSWPGDGVSAQAVSRRSSTEDVRVEASGYPDHELTRGLVVSGLGFGAGVTGLLVSPDIVDVPAAGLDPSQIRWSLDRGIIGNSSASAASASHLTRNAAMLMPWVLAWAVAPEGRSWSRMGAHAGVYAETFAVSMGLVLLGKAVLSRPRPFNYLAEGDRPTDGSGDVTAERAFFSMPSGHAASAWTGASLAMTEHLLYRQEARGLERIALGFLGGALGTSTAALRVAAGQHFPTDVIAGSLLGAGSGVAVPLLHKGSQTMPSGRAWLEMWGGALAGSVVGILIGAAF